MPSIPNTWCAALAAGCLLTATHAEARRWSHGASNRLHRAASVVRAVVHGASAVGAPRDTPRRDPSETPPLPSRPGRITRVGVWVSGGVATAGYRVDPPSARFFDEEPEPKRLWRLGLDAQSVRSGGGLGLAFGLEEERWGISARMTSLSLRTQDGLDPARLHVGTAHVTFAAAVSHKGRLRLEGGAAVTRAPGVTFVGPSLAMSFERCLLGELDLEGSAQWVPFPQLQLDAQLGVALHLGPLAFRAGWRGLVINDRGYVNGTPRGDAFGGPFAGLGLAF
jgi:hypothetical protein